MIEIQFSPEQVSMNNKINVVHNKHMRELLHSPQPV